MSALFNSLLATIIISLVSIIGIFFIFIKPKTVSKLNLFLVSLAIGCLLGDSFICLIPESFEQLGFNYKPSLLLLGGIILFFILEKIIRWRHCHDPHCLFKEGQHKEGQHVVTLNLIGDAVHNFIDGALIAASFQISFSLGLTTSLAVLLHEIPEEISDFGVFIHYGLSIKRAALYNFLSALTSLLGVLFVFLVNFSINNFSQFLIPITAGGFIYLAASDLIPELHRHESKISTSLLQLSCIILGIGLTFLLSFLE